MPKDVFSPWSMRRKQWTIAFYFFTEIKNNRNKSNNDTPFN